MVLISACSLRSTGNTVIEPSSESLQIASEIQEQTSPNPSASPHISSAPQSTQTPPPPSFTFYSLDEIRNFLELSELDDQEFEEYLNEHWYYPFYGINSKTDIRNIEELFEKLPFPKTERCQFTFMGYYPDDKCYIITYMKEEGFCQFCFIDVDDFELDARIAESIESKDIKEIEIEQPTPIRRLYALNDMKEFSDDPGFPDDIRMFYADIGGYFTRIKTRGFSDEEAESLLREFEFGKLSEILGRK